MVGQNVVINDGKRRCRQCWVDARRHSRHAKNLREKTGFAEPIENLTLRELTQRLDQARVMLETAEQALNDTHKAFDRQNKKLQRAKRNQDRAQEQFEAAAQLVQKVEQLRTEKANAEHTF